MNTHAPAVGFLKLSSILFCSCVFLLLHTTAFGISKNDVLTPLKNNLSVYESALAELNRQVKTQFSQFDAQQQTIEKDFSALEAEEQCALEENEASREADNNAVLTGWQLITELNDRISLPGYERGTMDELLAVREEHRKELETLEAKIATGTKKFFVAGLGMVNKKALETRRNDLEEKRSSYEQKVNDGSVRIDFPKLGSVSKKELENAIASQKEKIETVTGQIAEGTYVVSIPGLGDVSKKQLKAKIAALKKQINTLSKEFKEGKVRINRSSKGWFSASDLKKATQALQETTAALNKQYKQHEYKHLLPIGWVTLKDLDERISQVKKEKAAIERLVAGKQYKIALPDGSWATEKDIDKALMNSLLSPEIKAALEAGKKSISMISRYEINNKALEIAKLKKWRAEFKKHMLPLSDKHTRQKKDLDTLQKEFSVEQRLTITPLQRRLAFLQKSLRQLP